MDVRIKIDWPEMVAALKECLAARNEMPQRAPSAGEAVSRSESDASPMPDAGEVVTLEQVRAKLAALSQAGQQESVKSLITEFGGTKLSDIEPGQYGKLLAKAEELA